jgi:colanic acid/amylovoran biosynthesis glycosyltransferase
VYREQATSEEITKTVKIIFCAYDGRGYFGGPLEWYKRLAPALRGIGIETGFLFITDHKPELCGTYMALREAGFECHALRRHSLTQLRDNTEARVRWILRHLREDPPDIFVANLSVPACYAARWAREAGIPTFCIQHSDFDFCTEMMNAFVRKDGAFRLTGTICVSHALYQVTAQCCGSGPRVEFLPYGVPVPAVKAKWAPERLRIAYVGRLAEEQKRICDLTQAFCRATSEVDGVDAVLFGDGKERGAVEQVIHGSGCGSTVHLAGQIDSAHIQDELLKRRIQVVVLLSDYEGLPIALLESMACGLVPVCLNIRSGIPELVKHEETGLLVEDRGDSFVQAIRRLRMDRELWEGLSTSARDLVHSRYSMDMVAQRWRALAENQITDAAERSPIQIPRYLDLPPVNETLSSDDRRWPGWLTFVRRQACRLIRHCSPGRPR